MDSQLEDRRRMVSLAAPLAGEASAVAPAASPWPCEPRRVLIVDDDEPILALFHTILSRSIPGSEVDRVHNGAEAVEAFALKHHAVVLMDLHMPVMDGRRAFLAIEDHCRQHGWAMPSVVFCTGYAPPDAVNRLVAGDPRHALLSKPVDARTLIDAVRSRLT